jgi:pectinesterase
MGMILTAATALGADAPVKPFTRATVAAELRDRYPNLAFPSDELPKGIGAAENVVYAQVGGTALALDLYTPEAGGPFPAILIVHGGGWESGDRRMERPLAAHLAALGYVAAPADYRLGTVGRFPAALYDLKCAVRWLRAHARERRINPDRIAAVGASSGGQLVALLGATNGAPEYEGNVGEQAGLSAVQAVVDIDGLADFTDPELVRQQEVRPSSPTRFLGGPFATRASVWGAASALTHVGPRSAPTLFINSTAPTPILPGRAAMCNRLRALGIDSEIVVIPDTPHPFWLAYPWFDRTVAEIDRFLRRHFAMPAAGD